MNPRELDFSRLRARLREKPRTKVGQVRQAWPEIRALIAAGHSLKDIWAWVNEIGIEIGYARLSHYIGQLKRKDSAGATASRGLDSCDVMNNGDNAAESPYELNRPDRKSGESASQDPLINLRAREQRPVGFKYNPDLDLKKLI